MDRYKNTNIINNKYAETIFPKIELSDDDIYIYAKEGDRLDNLANKYYQDNTLWWVIARANDLSGDSMFIEVPLRLRIPMDLNRVLNRINVR